MYFYVPRPAVTALDKTVSGRRLVVQIGEWTSGLGSVNRGWLRAFVDGGIVCSSFTSYVTRDATVRAELPHLLHISSASWERPEMPFGLPDSDLKHEPYLPDFGLNIGLTDEEADAFEAAREEYDSWPARQAQAATPPGAETWVEEDWIFFPLPGTIKLLARGPVMVLGLVGETWVEEDGRSLNLDDETGYLYSARVRDLTPDETAWYEQERTA